MKPKIIKQQEAIERNNRWKKKDLGEKLEILLQRPGMCKKQLAKLYEKWRIDKDIKIAEKLFSRISEE